MNTYEIIQYELLKLILEDKLTGDFVISGSFKALHGQGIADFKLQIEQGTKATPYEPTTKTK